MAETPKKSQVREWTKSILLALGVAMIVRVGIAQAYVIDGPSMEPTLLQNERVVVTRFDFGLALPFVHDAVLTWALPNVGDVVIIESPRDGEDLVKRVVGLPGDVVEIQDGVVLRNGHALADGHVGTCATARFREPEPSCETREERSGDHRWQTSDSPAESPGWMSPVRVPAEHVFILGDHRDRSNDSRYFGPVDRRLLRGRARFLD